MEELAKLEAERGNPEYLSETGKKESILGKRERTASKEIRQQYGGGGSVLQGED